MSRKKEHTFVEGSEFKECSKCHISKELKCFDKDKGKWDGLYPSCKECVKIKSHVTYAKDPKKRYEKVIAYMKKTGAYSAYKPYNPKYYSSEKSKLKHKARDFRRRALKYNANQEHKITNETILFVVDKYERKCAYCSADCSSEYHIDHKLPLSRGGTNNIDNLALSCPHCNWSKGKKTDVEFIGHCV